MAEVEPEVAVAAVAHQRYPGGRGRAHAGPFDGGVEIAALRERVPRLLAQQCQARGLEAGVEADDVDHRGDPQPLADSRVDDLAVVIGDAGIRRAVLRADRQGQAIALERV